MIMSLAVDYSLGYEYLYVANINVFVVLIVIILAHLSP